MEAIRERVTGSVWMVASPSGRHVTRQTRELTPKDRNVEKLLKHVADGDIEMVSQTFIFLHFLMSGRSKRGCEGRAPLSVQILSFSFSFWQKCCKIIGWRPPPHGESWIHPCISFKFQRISVQRRLCFCVFESQQRYLVRNYCPLRGVSCMSQVSSAFKFESERLKDYSVTKQSPEIPFIRFRAVGGMAEW